MNEGTDLLAELYPRCFCRTNRRPLKVGIYEEVISQHPEMSGPRIKRLLKKYTQCPEYWSTLTAGSARIDLEGNPVGTVTEADEADAKRKIAKEAGRAAAKAIEDRKAAAVPSVTQRVSQVDHVAPSPMKPESAPVTDLPSSPIAAARQPTVPAGQGRLGLAGLKAAAQARRARLVAAR
jgi:sRNA-binding protein